MNASKVIPIRRISSADVRTPTNSEVSYRYIKPDNTEWLRFSDGTEVKLSGSGVYDSASFVLPDGGLQDLCVTMDMQGTYVRDYSQTLVPANTIFVLRLAGIQTDGSTLVLSIGNLASFRLDCLGYTILDIDGTDLGYRVDFPVNTKFIFTIDGQKIKMLYRSDAFAEVLNDLKDIKTDQVFTDWYLPSATRLQNMYNDLHALGKGNFTEQVSYWTCEQNNSNTAVSVNMADGTTSNTNKDEVLNIRPIREFTSDDYNEGDIGPSGGLIFRKAGNNCYECAKEDVLPAVWGTMGVNVGGLIAGPYSGPNNTPIIAAASAENGAKNVEDYVSHPVKEDVLQYNGQYFVNNKLKYLGPNTSIIHVDTTQSLQDLLLYLSKRVSGPTRLLLDAGSYPVVDTITINLPFPLLIEGAGANTTRFFAASGLENKPMFDIQSEVWFDKFEIDGTILAGWGDNNTENVFNIATSGLYLEGKDFIINGGYHAVNMTGASEIFFLDRVIENTQNYAINIDSAGVIGIDSEIGTISNCNGGYKFAGATGSEVIIDGVIIDGVTDYGIDYDGANFVANRMEIKGCGYDYSGLGFTHGFDWTLQRDANIEMISNVGDADKKPMAGINLVENTATQALTSNTWTKISFTNTSSSKQKFTIADNRMTFQSNNPKNLMFWISGNMQVTTSTSNLNVAIVKNGNTALGLFGNQSIFADVNNRNFAFSLNTMIENVVKDDYFELRCQPVGANETIRLVDVNILCDSR